MSNYQKIWGTVSSSLMIIIFASLIYGSVTTVRVSTVTKRLKTVTADSLNQILIVPSNPDWNINLTLDTIRITDKTVINSITNQLNNPNENYPGRGISKTWEADLILDFKNNSNIKLEVLDAQHGICVFYTNTMGTPKFKCDGLKKILESISNYKKPLGRKR